MSPSSLKNFLSIKVFLSLRNKFPKMRYFLTWPRWFNPLMNSIYLVLAYLGFSDFTNLVVASKCVITFSKINRVTCVAAKITSFTVNLKITIENP